jgi:hypothetical protein
LNLYPLIKQLHRFDLLHGRHCWQFLFALLGAPCTSYVRCPRTSYTVFIPVYLWTMLLAFILLQLLTVTVSLTGDHGWQQHSFWFNSTGCRMQGISLRSSSKIKNTIQAFLTFVTVLLILPQHQKSFHFLLNGIIEY